MALLLGLALVAGACGGSTPPPTGAAGQGPATAPTDASPGSSSAARPATGDGAAAVLRSPTVDEVRAYEADLQAAFVAAAGVDAALGDGGWAFVDGAMHAAVDDALAKAGVATRPAGIASRSTGLDPLPLPSALGAGAIGVGFAAGLVRTALSNPSSGLANADIALDSTSERTANGERTQARITGRLATNLRNGRVSGTADIGIEVSIFDASTGQLLRTMRFRVTGTIDLDICPDASGKVRGHVSLALDAGTSTTGAGSMTIDADVIGTVNDDAHLAAIDASGSTTEHTTSASGTARSSTVSARYRTAVQNGTFDPNAVTDLSGQVDAETGEPLTNDEVTERYERIGSATGVALYMLAAEAEKQWRGGACVEIHATERSRDVRPRQHVQFEAKPFHKIEQRDLSKPIVGTFTGEASADPLDVPVPAPALFDYVASPTKDHSGTITLKSTSNRGIGELSITFTTRIKGWKVDAASGGGRIQGQHCGDLPGEWDVTGTYNVGGMRGQQLWVIKIDSSGTSGTHEYVSTSHGRPGGSPVVVFTEGEAKGNVTLTVDSDGHVHMHFKETARTYRAWTEVGGKGSATPTQREESDMEWEPDPTC